MFAVLYSFKVKIGKDQQFVDSWRGLTKLIYKHEGSLGSRLHKEKEGEYLAYAQWPSKDIWENSGKNMPPEAEQFRVAMRESCLEIKTIHTLSVTDDLLQSKPY